MGDRGLRVRELFSSGEEPELELWQCKQSCLARCPAPMLINEQTPSPVLGGCQSTPPPQQASRAAGLWLGRGDNNRRPSHLPGPGQSQAQYPKLPCAWTIRSSTLRDSFPFPQNQSTAQDAQSNSLTVLAAH